MWRWIRWCFFLLCNGKRYRSFSYLPLPFRCGWGRIPLQSIRRIIFHQFFHPYRRSRTLFKSIKSCWKLTFIRKSLCSKLEIICQRSFWRLRRWCSKNQPRNRNSRFQYRKRWYLIKLLDYQKFVGTRLGRKWIHEIEIRKHLCYMSRCFVPNSLKIKKNF